MIVGSKFEKKSLLTKVNKLEACFHTANANAIKMFHNVTYMLQVLFMCWVGVTTLALGSQLRQKGVARLWAKRKSGVMPHTPKSARSVREWALTLPRQHPKRELESRWTLETSESDCKGQNSSRPYHWKAIEM
jgi:hypothetical protein